jgi:uncharacterized protein
VALVALEIRVPDADLELWPYLAKKALQALIGGLLIGVLEETFFRGALYTAIRRRDGVASAVVWTAFLYMLVHFMKPSALPEGVLSIGRARCRCSAPSSSTSSSGNI